MAGDSVDRHRSRDAIEAAIARGKSVRAIADQFGVSKSTIQRHKDRMAARMASAPSAEHTGSEELLAKVRNLHTEAEAILTKSKQAGDHKTALSAIREARSNLELLAKMLGELQSGTNVNVVVSNQWVELRADLIGALRPFPDALIAVMHALENHDPSD